MPLVRFAWSPCLVDLRRETCPRARWLPRERAWSMSAEEATTFFDAAHRRLEFVRSHAELTIDGVPWVIGFARDAPYRSHRRAEVERQRMLP
jgi:hypothetical protein